MNMYVAQKRAYMPIETKENGGDILSIMIPDIGQVDCRIKNKRIIIQEELNDLYEYIKSIGGETE